MSILDGLNLYANSFKYYYGSDRASTFVRGFLKQNFRFPKVLTEQELLSIDKRASILAYTAIFTAIVLFICYFYFVFFTNYLAIINLPRLVFALALSVPVMIAILIPYLIADFAFKNYLKRFGDYSQDKSEFKIPANASEKSIPGYERIKGRVVKEAVFGILLVLILLGFALFVDNAPRLVVKYIKQGKYEKALKSADLSVKILPVSSRYYGYRGAAKYYMKDYAGAVEDYKLANKYSMTEFYDEDMFIAKSKMLNKAQMIEEYDKSIKAQKESVDRYTAMFAKANYLLSLKDYKAALPIYNQLLTAYRNDEHLILPPEELYIRRALTHAKLGDAAGYKSDFNAADSMCPECEFSKVTEQQLVPKPSLDY